MSELTEQRQARYGMDVKKELNQMKASNERKEGTIDSLTHSRTPEWAENGPREKSVALRTRQEKQWNERKKKKHSIKKTAPIYVMKPKQT